MILDAACWLGRWPFWEVEPDTAAELVARQASRGISLSCVAALEAAFYVDPRPANLRLFRELRTHPTLDPVAVLNLGLAHWPDAFRHYTRRYGCRQVRLMPAFHGYRLDHPAVDELCAAAAAAHVAVGVQIRLIDAAAPPMLAPLPVLELEPLLAFAARHPRATFLALGATFDEAVHLRPARNLLLELSHVEHLETLDSLLARLPAERLVLGTHTPLQVTSAALAKLRAARASAEAKARIAGGNLARWLGGEAGRVPYREPGLE